MMIKRLFTLFLAAIFTLSLASPALSTGMNKEVNGVVSKIEGSTLTVLDSTGNEEIINAKDQEVLKDLKVGDRVSMKGDMLTKKSAESPAPGSQR
jgi:hypothetical protein